MKASYAFRETTGTILGPMPPLEFLNTFLPAPTQGRGRKDPQYNPHTFKEFSTTRKDESRYQQWVDALEPFCGRTVVQVDTHRLPVFREDKKELGPQVCVYRSHRGFEPPNFLDMRNVEMSVHFSEQCDPFNDVRAWRLDPFERTGDKAQALLGEIALAASTQLSLQYRTHVFSMLVLPDSVRFLRWDRAGVIDATANVPTYRQVMEELEGPLTSCKSVKDVVTALRDASQAQAEAYDKANILHSDSSLSNVMIKYEGDQVRGYLIDWDLSQDLDDDPEPTGPVGQWRFMAARIQSLDFWRLRYRQDHVDDMESLFHDLIYVLVYYMNFDDSLMNQYFNESEMQGGTLCGGKTKISLMTREGKSMCSRIGCDPLRNLVKTLARVLSSRYVVDGPDITKELADEAQINSNLLFRNPYWMSKVLTHALKQPGWGEDELLRGNDPDDMDAEAGLDWEEIAREMKERNKGRGRKKRKLQ
ncbi:hypothetical protein BDN72DRAFT_961767 [Pluteus cervinus]|uniref:Uncharacterized protein n=1 Tax=Pluteus cervinus TaxID=181527 RepID=A0ACD3ALM3_9AGAR|nr:hypothetical protein BDN72DRAFT_961767 [Pluteus cervinus]